MNVVSQLVDIIKEFRDKIRTGISSNDLDKIFDKPIQSVAARAKQSILYFPLVVSESIGADTAALLQKFVQTRAAVYTRLTIAIEDVVQIEGDKDSKSALLKRVRGSSLKDAVFAEDCQVVNATLRGPDGAHLCELGCSPASESLRPALLEAINKKPLTLGKKVAPAVDPLDAEVQAVADVAVGGVENLMADVKRAQAKNNIGGGGPSANVANDVAGLINKADVAAEKKGSSIGDKEMEKLLGSATKIADKDAELLNKERPLLLELDIVYKAEGGQMREAKLLIAVKAVVHPIPTVDVVAGVGSALAGDSLVFQFLRATSGEISFLGDFLLNIEGAKQSVATASSGEKLLGTLRRQSAWNKRARNAVIKQFSARGEVPPSATVVITSDEAEQIRSIYGVDLSKATQARAFLTTHNLFGFMIVDEAIGLARVYEDGSDDFERVTLAEMKEKGKDTSLRDAISFMDMARR